ncbi:hypothetical protein [Chryseobacterium oncorhynchi]|nr:hypothetical protein [Chryseobacterium oncorhynchi]
MMYTNEFFAVGNTAPNDDLVQLIDSFTGENVNFRKVNTWIDGQTLGVNDPKVLNDEIIYRSRGSEYYVNTVVFSSKRVYVTTFGVVSDLRFDQRSSVQKAINICSELRLKLVFPNGYFLINSYTDDIKLRGAHSNILELKSNLDIEFEEYSVIQLGTYFDNKNFVLFSGFNHEESNMLTPISNITLKGKGTIDFNGNLSQIRGKDRNRIIRRFGFEGGNCTNVLIDGLHWVNGDLSNCIGTGWAENGNKFIIQNCIFEELTKSHEESNYDHSTIYGNANFLTVHNNIFIGNEQMKLVGCACEIHGSNASFSNNKIYNYLRMNFVVGNIGEKGSVSDISISDNIAEVTSGGVYIWPNSKASVSNLLISSNNIKHIHVPGKDMWYNGTQCLFIIQGKGGDCKRITVRNNVSHILYTNGNYSRYAAGIASNVESLEICDNHFIGHSLGISFDLDHDELNPVLSEYSFIKISGNNFTSSSKLVKIEARKLDYCLIAYNSTVLDNSSMENLIEINSDIIQSTTVRDNIYISNQPKVEFAPSSVFLADPSNKAKYVLSLVSTPVPTVNGGGSAFISPVLSSNHKRVGGMYTIQPTYPFPELFFNAHTFGAGGTSDVKFKVDNMTSTNFVGNPNLVSNLIVNL